jgi:hypothetical protein
MAKEDEEKYRSASPDSYDEECHQRKSARKRYKVSIEVFRRSPEVNLSIFCIHRAYFISAATAIVRIQSERRQRRHRQ